MKLIVRCPQGSLGSAAFHRTEAAKAGPRGADGTSTRTVRARTWKAWAVPVALIALCAAVGLLRDGGWTAARVRPAGVGAVEQAGARQAMPRLVYPYSVVPGGIEDGAEVAEALARDPVVEAHYAGFRADRARVVHLSEPRLVYVSYRVKDQVYWTRKKVKLHKGEKIITDGKELIRARCGNRISDEPKARVALVDPPEVSLDTPLLPLPLVALARPIEEPAGAPAPLEEKETEGQPVPVVTPGVPAMRTGIFPIMVPVGGGGRGVPPGSPPPAPGSPAGTPASGGTPPGTPPVAPAAPAADPPPAQPPSAPPPATPGNPPGGGDTPPAAPPSNPPSTPSTEPPATPPGTPVVPPGTQPPPPDPLTPSVTPPGSVPPGVSPPAGTPPGPLEPPLPGGPPVPNGITPPGPGPIPPPDVNPPPAGPFPTPEPPPVTPIPEPSTYVLIGCGLVCMALLNRRRNRA